MTTTNQIRLHHAAAEAVTLIANTGRGTVREGNVLDKLRAALADEAGSPTPGPYTVQYIPYPCPKDGEGEPNPPAAFICPACNNEAIALVFGQGDDPFDSPSQRGNANLFVEALNVRRACTPAALHWLAQLIDQAERDGCDVDAPEMWREMIAANRALLAALRAAVAAGGGAGI